MTMPLLEPLSPLRGSLKFIDAYPRADALGSILSARFAGWVRLHSFTRDQRRLP